MLISLSKYRAVIFDMNGTMINDSSYQLEAFHRFFQNHHVQLTEEEYAKKVSNRINKEIMANVFGKDISAAETKSYAEEKEHIYLDLYRDHITEVPGLTKLVTDLHEKGLKLAIASTAGRSYVEIIVKALHLQTMFPTIVSGDEVHHGKPDPEIYQTALTHLEIDSDHCLAFEDSLVGVKAAVAAGITVIGITTTHSHSELVAVGATGTVADFTELEIVA